MAKARKGRKYVSGLLVFFLIILLLLLSTITGALLSYSYVRGAQASIKNPKQISIPVGQRIYLDIPSGSSTSKIADLLHDNELIKYPQIFKIMSKVNGYDGRFQSGTHIVSKELGYEELMMVLIQNPEILRLTFREGLNSKQVYQEIQ